MSCNATYIGETGRLLGIRIKEHLAGKRRGNVSTPLGKHKVEVHHDSDYEVKCVILAHETEITARKALEAAWICTKDPPMNNRNECPSMTNELLPFLSLCEL